MTYTKSATIERAREMSQRLRDRNPQTWDDLDRDVVFTLNALIAHAEWLRGQLGNDQDAKRYRHMRNNAQFQYRNGPGLYWYLPRYSDGKVRDEGQQLDDAIDAAIQSRENA